MIKKDFLNLKIIARTIMVFGVIFVLYAGLRQVFVGGKEDFRNTSLSSLSEMHWGESLYKVYYETQNGLYSIYANGKERQQLHFEPSSFILLNATKQILLKERSKIFLFDENGQEKSLVFSAPFEKLISHWRISPDEKMIILQVFDENKWDNSPIILDDIYVVNIKTKNIRRLDNSTELNDFGHVDLIIWSRNNLFAYISTTTYLSENNRVARYFSYNIDSNLVRKIGEEPASLRHNLFSIEGFIQTSPLVRVEKDSKSRKYYYSRMSPDGKRLVKIDHEGNIKVNDEVVIFWLGEGMKGKVRCSFEGWMSDNNHFIVDCFGLRVVEVNTKKVAELDLKGLNPQWFGQQFEESH